MNEMLLAQAVAKATWSPVTITLITTCIVAAIGAAATGIVKVINALNETKKAVVETKALVDGRYGLVLTKLAEVLGKLADKTGSPDDRAAAMHADGAAKDQQAIVDKVNGKA